MSHIPSWFNPEEYSEFITESLDLLEFNAPYWKKRKEILLDRRNRKRAQAIRDGRENAQNANELAQAKAEGIMRGMAEAFKMGIHNKFMKIVEEKTAIQQTKAETRQETDPKRKERDRKREERKQAAKSPMSNVLIVQHKRTGKTEIIMKSDYNQEYHEVIKGRVKGIDKGPVSKADLIRASESPDFMNTKTSMKLIGKIEKGGKENKDESLTQGGAATGSEGAPSPPPPPARVPQDGKEITDPTSTYPDWDHDNSALEAGLAHAINPNQPVPPELMQMFSVSRTLGDSVSRAVNALIDSSPELAETSFQALPPVVNTGKGWATMFQIPQSAPNATVIAIGPEDQKGISIKVGQQIRPGIKGEAGNILTALLSSSENSGEVLNTFSLMLDDFFNKLREVLLNALPQIDREAKYREGSNALRYQQRRFRERYEKNKNLFKNRVKNLIEDFINQNEDLKSAFILESLTGNIKFENGPGSAQMMIHVNKDGTDAKLISLDENFGISLGKAQDTYLSLKFADLPTEEGNFMETLYQKMIPINEAPIDVLMELEKIKGQLANPLVLMQVFNVQLIDAVYSTPIDYCDFNDEDSEVDNIITLNPDSAEEEEIRIPVKKVYTSLGKEENRIELGADQIFEEYLLFNDYLTDLISNKTISTSEALSIINEEFNFLCEAKKKKKKKKKKKRNYRKEYDEYHGTAEQRANRSKRVLARRKMMKKGRVRKGDGKDVDHKNGNPQDNSDGNLRVLSKSKNRSIKEDHGAGFEGTPELVKKLINDTPGAQTTPVLFGSRPYPEAKLKKPKK